MRAQGGCVHKVGRCKGSFGGCQGQPLARPWHLLISSLGLTALPPSSVCLSPVLGYCLPYALPYRPLPSTPYVIHARLACSLPYTLAICLTNNFCINSLSFLLAIALFLGSLYIYISLSANASYLQNINYVFR